MSNATHHVALPGSEEKKQESRNAQKVLRLLANKLKLLGFERTKPSFFTRPSTLAIEFVHVHKFTFGPAFRLHFGIRVRNDEFPAAALNGPSSDTLLNPTTPGRAYRFSYTPDVQAFDPCADAMAKLVAIEGIQWFESMRNPAILLSPTHSPLSPSLIAAFERALTNPLEAVSSAATRRALNAA